MAGCPAVGKGLAVCCEKGWEGRSAGRTLEGQRMESDGVQVGESGLFITEHSRDANPKTGAGLVTSRSSGGFVRQANC